MKSFIVYSDGAISRKIGGWASVIIENGVLIKSLAGFELNTTNNRMELRAVIEALEEIEEDYGLNDVEIRIISDSQYVVNGATTWLKKWKNNNWKAAAGKVKNRDLWEQMDYFVVTGKVSFYWVRGHNGDHYNEMVDKLAVAQYKQFDKKKT